MQLFFLLFLFSFCSYDVISSVEYHSSTIVVLVAVVPHYNCRSGSNNSSSNTML